MGPRFISAQQAAELIGDRMTVLTVGFTLLGVAEEVYAAIEHRYSSTGSPSGLTLVHGAGQSDTIGGLEHFAHPGLLKRIVGAHWGLAPKMRTLIAEDQIEAYSLPQGQLVNLFKAMAAGRPGILSSIGLETFVDPAIEGGKVNRKTASCENLVERVELDGQVYLWYKALPVDIAIIRGTTVDEDGNLTTEEEAVKLEILSAALSARRSGGRVIAQVKRVARRGTLHPKDIVVPGPFIDYVVVASRPETSHRQTASSFFDPSYSGDLKVPAAGFPRLEASTRKVIGMRAAMELRPGMIVNLGTGIPGDTIGPVSAEMGLLDEILLTVESGLYGGIPLGGTDFGAAISPIAIINHQDQFDFYNGSGVDIAFMGAAQVDRWGNVNSSRFGDRVTGCGGFIDITQGAKKIVFCLNFTAGAQDIEVGDGRLVIRRDGEIAKFVEEVGQITFSGRRAISTGQKVVYVTERAVFELTERGLTLVEVAPGVDAQTQVLGRMAFRPVVDPSLRLMPRSLFTRAQESKDESHPAA